MKTHLRPVNIAPIYTIRFIYNNYDNCYVTISYSCKALSLKDAYSHFQKTAESFDSDYEGSSAVEFLKENEECNEEPF